MECCGVSGPKDWNKVTNSDKLPISCCHEIPLNGSCTLVDSFQGGCFDKLNTNIQENSNILIWAAIGIAVIQVCRTVVPNGYKLLNKEIFIKLLPFIFLACCCFLSFMSYNVDSKGI